MIKTAIEGTLRATAAMQSLGAASGGKPSSTTNPSSSRFPPIENALSEIINNKRLEEAKRDV